VPGIQPIHVGRGVGLLVGLNDGKFVGPALGEFVGCSATNMLGGGTGSNVVQNSVTCALLC